MSLSVGVNKEHVNSWDEKSSEVGLSKRKMQIKHGGSGLFDPRDVETAGDECVGVGHLLDDFAGGLAGTVTGLCVDKDEQGICLLGATAHNVLQGGNVFEGVERHYPVIVVPCQQQDCRVLDPIAFWDTDVMQWRVSGRGKQIEIRNYLCGTAATKY